jgi:hypothetical protein
MAETVSAGTIIAKFLVDLTGWKKGLGEAKTDLTGFIGWVGAKVAALAKTFINMGDSIRKAGAKVKELGGQFTSLAGVLFAPMVLSMKSFADGNAEAQAKFMELSKKIQEESPKNVLSFLKMSVEEKRQLQLLENQRSMYQRVSVATSRAAAYQTRLATVLRAFNFEIGKLLWEALEPYIKKIIDWIDTSRKWVIAHKPFIQQLILLIAKFGAVSLILGPLLGALGSFLIILGTLLSPIGLLAAALGGLCALFKDQLNPVIDEHYVKIKALFESWAAGSLTTETAINLLSAAMKSFAFDILKTINDEIAKSTGGIVNIGNVIKTFLGIFDNFYIGMYQIWLNIFSLIDRAKETISNFCDMISDSFSFAKDNVLAALNSIKQAFDWAIGHSWWTDAMKKNASSNHSRHGRRGCVIRDRRTIDHGITQYDSVWHGGGFGTLGLNGMAIPSAGIGVNHRVSAKFWIFLQRDG